ICPRTGLLTVARKSRSGRPPRLIQGGASIQYHWRDNAWWEVSVRKLPDDPRDLFDIWLEKDVAQLAKGECQLAYGGELLAAGKRPLLPAEVRKLLRTLREQAQHRRKVRAHYC